MLFFSHLKIFFPPSKKQAKFDDFDFPPSKQKNSHPPSNKKIPTFRQRIPTFRIPSRRAGGRNRRADTGLCDVGKFEQEQTEGTELSASVAVTVSAISVISCSNFRRLSSVGVTYLPRLSQGARIDEITCAPGQKPAESALWLSQAQPDLRSCRKAGWKPAPRRSKNEQGRKDAGFLSALRVGRGGGTLGWDTARLLGPVGFSNSLHVSDVRSPKRTPAHQLHPDEVSFCQLPDDSWLSRSRANRAFKPEGTLPMLRSTLAAFMLRRFRFGRHESQRAKRRVEM